MSESCEVREITGVGKSDAEEGLSTSLSTKPASCQTPKNHTPQHYQEPHYDLSRWMVNQDLLFVFACYLFGGQ